MMEFKFDLQMFAAGDVDFATGVSIGTATGVTQVFLQSDGTISKTKDGNSVATIGLTGAIAAGGNVDTTNIKSITVYGVSAAAKNLVLTGIGDVTISNSTAMTFDLTAALKVTAKSLTIKGSKITGSFNGLVFTNGAGAIYAFDSASGTVETDKGSLTLSGATVTVNPIAATTDVTSFTKGTVKTDASFTGKVCGTTAALNGAYTLSASNNGDTVSVAANGSQQTTDLTNTGAITFKFTGNDTKEVITLSSKNADSVSAGGGADTIYLGDLTTGGNAKYVDGGAGNDSISAPGVVTNVKLYANTTIKGGAGKDTIDFSAVTVASSEIYFSGDEGDDEINISNAASYITNSTVSGGAGKDTIRSSAASNVLTGGADVDAFDIAAGDREANISDYKFGEDVLLVTGTTVANTADTLAQNAGGTKLTNDGTSGYIDATGGADGKATITSSSGYFAVTLQDTKNNKVALGWVGENATNINASSLTTAAVMTGATNSEGDLLIGGAKADTLYAGTGDSIYGGAGKDSLNMAVGTYGVYVGIATDSGADTVTGFTTGFDIDAADAVYMVNGTSADFGASADGAGNLILKDGSASTTIAAGTGVTAGGAGAYELLVSGQKVAVAANKATITTDDLAYANYWIGTYDSTDKTGSAANLSGATDAVNVNLGDTDHIRYIYTVTGGSGNTTLMGGANAESLVAASGSTTSLYGGAGKDTLVSSSDSKTEFFFMNGAGNDEIQNFATGTDTDASDVLNFYGSALGSISRTDVNVVKVKTSDGSTLSVNQKTNSADEKLQWVSGAAKGVAKVATSSGSSLSYETDVTNYFGSSKKDTLAVNAGDGTDVNIWLDGSQGVSYSDIDVVDASGRAANTTIAGSAIAETITGGSGNSSVWGGAGQVADVLRSTSGSTTTFFYGLGNGSDNISGSANDTVNLFDIKLSDIASANIQNSQVIFTTSSKDTVTVSGAQTFQLADGSRWTANYSNNQWESAQ